MRIIGNADELRGHAHARLRTPLIPANRAFQNVIHTQIRADLLKRLPGTFVLHGTRARDDTQSAHHREPTRDLLGHPGGEVLVLGWPEVLEG